MIKTECLEDRKVWRYICDDCGVDALYPIPCILCNKHLCCNCYKYELATGLDSPPKYCNRCFTIGEKKNYFVLLCALKKTYEAQRATLINEWKRNCENSDKDKIC